MYIPQKMGVAMKTKVICDCCKAVAECDDHNYMPCGWRKLMGKNGKTLDVCPECGEQMDKGKVNENNLHSR